MSDIVKQSALSACAPVQILLATAGADLHASGTVNANCNAREAGMADSAGYPVTMNNQSVITHGFFNNY